MFFVGIVMLTVVWVIMFRFRRRRLYQLAKRIPSQQELPIIGHLHNLIGDTEHIMEAMFSISYEALENGSIAKLWIGPNLYFVMTDPVDIEYVLKTCLEKDDLHEYFRDIIGNGVVFAPLNIWRTRRKVILPAFSPKIVKSFVEVFSEQSQVLVNQIQARVGTGTFDLWPYFNCYTLDSVCETVMGTRINAQTLRNPPFLHSLNRVLNATCERIFHLWLQSDFIFRNLPNHKSYKRDLDTVHDFTDNVIKLKREYIKTHNYNKTEVDQEYGLKDYKLKTFLDLLIEKSNESTAYSDLELREEMLTLTVAGTDTSAVAMSFTLLLLGKHQEIQEKVYQELLGIYGNSERPLVMEDLSKMVYLERVIKESLRLHPPVPFIIRKVVEEITLRSVLPAGSGIPISIWGTHRNQKYWGEDAETFDPDRFSPERYNLAHPCAYIPFSSGPRNCLGYQYSMHSIKTSLSTILRKFRVLVPEGSENAKIRVKLDVMMKAAKGYEVALEQRTCKS